MADAMSTAAPSRGASCAQRKQFSWPGGCAGVTAPLWDWRREQTSPGPPALPPSRLPCEGKRQHMTQLCSPDSVLPVSRVRDTDTKLRNFYTLPFPNCSKTSVSSNCTPSYLSTEFPVIVLYNTPCDYNYSSFTTSK